MIGARKALAGLLIRAAHRIYRPRVTEFRAAGTFDNGAAIFRNAKTGAVIAGVSGNIAGGGGGCGGHYSPPDDGPVPAVKR